MKTFGESVTRVPVPRSRRIRASAQRSAVGTSTSANGSIRWSLRKTPRGARGARASGLTTRSGSELAERAPARALPALKLGPLDRVAVGGRGLDAHLRQDEGVVADVEMRDRPHQALAREVLARLLERRRHRIGRRHPRQVVAAAPGRRAAARADCSASGLAAAAVLPHDALVELHPLVTVE